MNPAPRTEHLLARFWAGLLIAGHLAWGLPAHALDTLRAGQEAETHSAGLEQTLTAGLEEPTDKEISDVIEVLWSEPDSQKRAQAGATLREWLITPLEQLPSPPQSVSRQDVIRISVKSLLDEIRRVGEWQRLSSGTFVRVAEKIQSANRDLMLNRSGILPMMGKWPRMNIEAMTHIVERYEELTETIRRKLNRFPVRQLNVYQEEKVAELNATLTSMQRKMEEVLNEAGRREASISGGIGLSLERVRGFRRSGDPILQKLPSIGMGEESGLEETQKDAGWLQQWVAKYRPATPTLTWMILGASVVRNLPLQVLAGLEEFQELKPQADLAGIALVHRSTGRPQTRLELAALVTEILAGLRYPPEAVRAGMEDLLQRLEAVAEAA